MILHGSKRCFETAIVDNELVIDIRRVLKKKKVGALHYQNDMIVIKDGIMDTIGSVTYYEMIVTRDNQYACVVYEKGGDAAPPDVMTAFPYEQPYIQKRFVV